MTVLEEISQYVQQGRAGLLTDCIERALAEQVPIRDILEKGLLDGMNKVNSSYRKNEVYVPEILISSHAMTVGLEVLEPYFMENKNGKVGTVILGTVRGDMHDIGKQLVKMMMESRGLEVIDIGIDVPARVFVEKAREHNAKVIACSALLTTTMYEIQKVVEAVRNSDLNGKVKVMAGGAPVSKLFCDYIHADCYTENALMAAEKAVELCRE